MQRSSFFFFFLIQQLTDQNICLYIYNKCEPKDKPRIYCETENCEFHNVGFQIPGKHPRCVASRDLYSEGAEKKNRGLRESKREREREENLIIIYRTNLAGDWERMCFNFFRCIKDFS